MLDIYDENGNHIGVEDRKIVHAKGLWHRTVHCWLVRGTSGILFQRRASTLLDNPRKFYTTASGHLAAGETLEEAFTRELAEEIGAEIKNPVKIMEGRYSADFRKADGGEFRDRAMYSVFFARDDRPLSSYAPQINELDGLIEMDMQGALRLFEGGTESQPAVGWLYGADGKLGISDLSVRRDDFVCNPGETLSEKFGAVIRKILEKL
ncbi:MAG: NUDIX domain-containing protein [Rickettsiales bacterium]|jgi:isopentenyldiphosphate isomerase|nr:NUDIX domain-containing protein [Rickettsiales bacterium]